LFRQEFSLGEIDLPDSELAGKHPAFFDANRPGCHIALQRTLPMDRYRLSDNLSRHLPFDFDVLRPHPPKAVNVRFAINDYVPGADAARHFPRVVNCRGIAMQIAAQPAFNQSGLALHTTTGEITFAGKMYIAAGANASTETAGDFVIAQIDMGTARRTDRGCRSARNLLFAFTFETLDDGIALPLPKILEFAEKR
jgi:hypothetical protein